MTLVRNELAQKMLENKELQNEIQKLHDVKENYKQYYEKLRAELVKQKKNYEMLKEQSSEKNNSEISELKNQIIRLQQQISMQSDLQGNNNANLNTKFDTGFNQQKGNPAYTRQQLGGFSPQKTPLQMQQQQQVPQDYPEYVWDKSNLGELDRLIQERDYLISTGDYAETDPLIIELNQQILQLQQI